MRNSFNNLKSERAWLVFDLLMAINDSYSGDVAPFTIHTAIDYGPISIWVSPNTTGDMALVDWEGAENFTGRGIFDLRRMRWVDVHIDSISKLRKHFTRR